MQSMKHRRFGIRVATLMAGWAGLAGLAAGSAALAAETAQEMGQPREGEAYCQNSCKGRSACMSATHSCGGQNACKGQGWLETKDPKMCKEMGGKWLNEKQARAEAQRRKRDAAKAEKKS
jgi:hypothetical protein